MSEPTSIGQLCEQAFAIWPNAEIVVNPKTHEVTIKAGYKVSEVLGKGNRISYSHFAKLVKAGVE